MYAITAYIESPREWIGTKSIPTFFLDENVQGITDEAHAVRIATSIIRATGDADNFVHVTAVKVS
jgi:hypothetical protein